jgi:hypothetical protein
MTKLKQIFIYIALLLAGGGTATMLGSRTFMPEIAVLNGATATSTGTMLLVKDYRNIKCAVDTSGSATATIKWLGTITDAMPSSTLAQSSTNTFSYLEIIRKSDGTSIEGDTGIVLSGTDLHDMYEINTNLLSWVAPVLTSYTTGTIDVKCVAGDNQ